jgi:nicotinamide-nucleotide amidase
MFEPQLLSEAERFLAALRTRGLKLAAAESCTGGLLAAALTEIPGASDVFERGFVTYSNAAKIGQLGVDLETLRSHGAVSGEVALAMAEGARRASAADVAVAVTGIAGPGGATAGKPVGLVYVAIAWPGRPAASHVFRFGDLGRALIRRRTVEEALRLLAEAAAA